MWSLWLVLFYGCRCETSTAPREPLESGEVLITRARAQARYPALFQLVAAMNPCPCGYLGDKRRSCRCTPDQVSRYRNRISGPLLDRIDLQVEVAVPPCSQLLEPAPTEPGGDSAAIQAQVMAARQCQLARQGTVNAQLTGAAFDRHCQLGQPERQFIQSVVEKLACSARAVHRILRVARTLADLDRSVAITKRHLSEALHYRRLDR